MRKLILLLALLVFAPIVWATDHTTASCEEGDVQSKLNEVGVVAGDIVRIKAGTCTWTTQVTTSKGIHLRGEADCTTGTVSGKTGIPTSCTTEIIDNITKDGTQASIALILTVNSPAILEVSNFAFTGMATDPMVYNQGHMLIQGTSTSPNVRIHHLLVDDAKHVFFRTEGCIYGVMDHVSYASDPARQLLELFHPCGDENGDTSWSTAISMGGANAFYLEDSVITHPTGSNFCIDGFRGARLVIRYNSFEQCSIVNHGTDTGGRWRSMRYMEIYNNTMDFSVDNGGPSGIDAVIWFRGGTGVVTDNDITGTLRMLGFNNFVKLNYLRETQPNSVFGTCDGTGTWDENGGGMGEAGYRCVDQPGAGTSDSISGNPPTPASWIHNALDPIYIWSNTLNDTPLNYAYGGGGVVKEDRDFYVGTARPGWSKYTYPHPLRDEAEGATPPVSSGSRTRLRVR